MRLSARLLLLAGIAFFISSAATGCGYTNIRMQLDPHFVIPVPLAGIGLKPIKPVEPDLIPFERIEFPDYVGKQGWARTWGGGDTWGSEGRDVAIDDAGNIYVTGQFEGANIDFSSGGNNRFSTFSSAGNRDAFLCKFSPEGGLMWARTWGGDEDDLGTGIAITDLGSIYVVGVFMGSVDFDPSDSNAAQRQAPGSYSCFLSKFDTDGLFQWVKVWEGTYPAGPSVAADNWENAYILGKSPPGDLDPGSGVETQEFSLSNLSFVSKYSPSGYFQWAVPNLPGTGKDITADSLGNIFFVGTYRDSDFHFAGPFTTPEGNSNDAFLGKLNGSGDLLWVRTWGGPSDDYAVGVAVSPSNAEVYVTGRFRDSVEFSCGQKSQGEWRTANGQSDGYISKFNSNGSFQWVRNFGGHDFDFSLDVAVSALGHVYVTGKFLGNADFNPHSGPDYQASRGFSDVFLSRYDSHGNYQWTRTWGGVSYDSGKGIATDPFGGIYVTGRFSEDVNFATSGISLHTAEGIHGAFLCTLPPTGYWGMLLGAFDPELTPLDPELKPIKPWKPEKPDNPDKPEIP